MLSPHWIGHLIAAGSILALLLGLWLMSSRLDRCQAVRAAAPAVAKAAVSERARIRVVRVIEAASAAAVLDTAIAAEPEWAEQEVPQEVRDALK